MTATESATLTKKERLSTIQMLDLMRLEVDKSLRHKYPLSCMVIGLDGYEAEDRLHRRALMPAIFRELKTVTFEQNVQGLGVFTEQYQLAIFPHVEPERLKQLAGTMIERAHGLPRPGPDHTPPVTLSVGISHNLHPGEMTFETIVEEAETGMELARSAGGDRHIQARDVETEIDRMRIELDQEIRKIKASQDTFFTKQAGLEEDWGRNLIEKALDLFRNEAEQTEGLLRVQRQIMELISGEVEAWRNSSSVKQMLDSLNEIDRLERRVAKLTESLDLTEEELKRVAAMKSIDLGVSSIYRSVQGLSSEEANAASKKEMLKNIFEANLALKNELASKR